MIQYVIYKNPRDFKGKCVARMWVIGAGCADSGGIIAEGKTVDEVREKLPPDLLPLPVYAHDDPVIAEVWCDRDEAFKPDFRKKCKVCGNTPIVPVTEMCGPCTWGEAETAGGNW